MPRLKRDKLGLLSVFKKIPVAEIEYKEKYPVAHEQRAQKYAELMKKGTKFKPIQVFGKRHAKDTFQVFDGHARVLAHRLLKLKTIKAEVTLVTASGSPAKTVREAIL